MEEGKTVINSSKSKKNLIIIAITNYDWEKIAIFFNSYVKAKFKNTDFVAFVNNVPEDTIKRLKSYGVIIIPFPEELKKVHIFSSRWAVISYFLRKNLDKYHLVFTADTRDGIFQKDVFKYYEKIDKPFLGLAYENGFLTQEITNRKWIRSAFGENYFKTLTNERIICMGTLWGSVDKVLQFSDKIYEILKTKPKAIDQAVGNYIIYHLKIFQDCTIISENYDGPIMTIGITNRAFINLDSNQNFINYKGDIAAFVHQYDRHKDLTKIVSKKYYTKVNESIPTDTDEPEPIQTEAIQSDIKNSEVSETENMKSDIKESDINISNNNNKDKLENKKDDNNKLDNKKSDNNKQDNKKNGNGMNGIFILVLFVIFILVSFIIGLFYIYKYKQRLTGKTTVEKCKYNLFII